MATGHADYAFLELTASAIAALSATAWTKVGSFPNCLAILGFNDLDKGFAMYFTDKQGADAPADAVDPHYKLAGGEPLFVNHKNIALFNSCDIYVKKLSSDPTTGSFRLTGIKVAPRKFKG